MLSITNEKIRKRWQGLAENAFPPKSKPRIWLHCASAGEYEQAIPVIEEIRNHLDVEICISFFSPSGMEYYQLYAPTADFVFYLPFDTENDADKLITALQPDTAIWIKYELWYNILSAIRRNNIPLYLIHADLRHLTSRKWPDKPIAIRALTLFDHIFSITQPVTGLSVPYELSNDTKWRRAAVHPATFFEQETLSLFCGSSAVIVAGSTHPKDIELIAQYLRLYGSPGIKWIIVPHEVGKRSIDYIRKQLSPARISLFSNPDSSSGIIITDKTGILKWLYRYADIAYIGGGFGKAVHNTLEAAAYRIPLISGENISGIPEAETLAHAGVLHTVSDAEELNKQIRYWLEADRSVLRQTCQQLFEANSQDNVSPELIRMIRERLFPNQALQL